ncbi:MAG: uroporphyrinogen decarboxylase family protein [bacterium]
MNSRERVILALNHKEPDRIPIDIGGTLATSMHRIVYDELKKELGIKDDIEDEILQFSLQTVIISEKMLEKLHGDILGIYPGPPKSWKIEINPEDNSYVDEWGIKYRLPKNGWYFDMVEHPLKKVTSQSLKRFNWPDPYDEGRFEGIDKKAKYFYENTDYAISVGKEKEFAGGVLQDCAWLVGFEEWFCLLASNQDLAAKVMDKVLEFHIGYWDAILSRIGRYVQVAVIGDDLGTQDSLIVSPNMYRDLIKPRHKELVDFIKSKAIVKVLLHSDGAIRKIIPDLIEIGIDILNPIQPTVRGMNDTKSLKEEFGKDIVFWGGGCDTQEVLPFGKQEDVEKEVKKRIEDLKPGGGFIFAPVHNIQPEVPIQNVLTLYESALKYGHY